MLFAAPLPCTKFLCYEKMIALKSIHPSFKPSNFKNNIHCTRILNRRGSILCLCKSSESDSQSPQPGELLAQIVMLEAQKVRLKDFIDKKSANLTQFREE